MVPSCFFLNNKNQEQARKSMNNHTCVLREVRGISQYVPIKDVFNLEVGERTFTGQFREETEDDGPSGSHKRTICLPVGQPSVSTLTAADIAELQR